MNDTREPHTEPTTGKTQILNARQVIRFLFLVFLTPCAALIAAWDAKWGMGWWLVCMIGIPAVVSRIIVFKKNPDLLVERGNFSQQSNVKSWDRLLAPIVGLFGPLASWIIAGLDRNFGWSDISPAVQWGSAGLLLLSVIFANWALVENKYFSAVVRIQADREQTVITGGPYRFVRHPGYAGGVVADLVIPLMLGSLWALIPAILTVIAIIIRTAKEDRALIEELPGYPTYAQHTRYRLFPGIW